MNKEEVKAALRCCIVRDPDDKKRCPECPYRDPAAYCVNRLFMDALKLLDEPEPVRLVTAEDFQRPDADGGGADRKSVV